MKQHLDCAALEPLTRVSSHVLSDFQPGPGLEDKYFL